MANFAEVLQELHQERSRLDQAIRAIEDLVARNRPGVIQTRATRSGRTVSAAARMKMVAAQQARRAKERGAKASKPVRTLSQAARRRISAAKRAWWAKKRRSKRRRRRSV